MVSNGKCITRAPMYRWLETLNQHSLKKGKPGDTSRIFVMEKVGDSGLAYYFIK